MVKKLSVLLETNNNNAFAEQPEQEVARILREAADRIERGDGDFSLKDINGNQCGEVRSLVAAWSA